MKEYKPDFIDAKKAFNDAIKTGTLNGTDPRALNYAGNYMYMHSCKKYNHFKNTQTRRYMKALRLGETS